MFKSSILFWGKCISLFSYPHMLAKCFCFDYQGCAISIFQTTCAQDAIFYVLKIQNHYCCQQILLLLTKKMYDIKFWYLNVMIFWVLNSDNMTVSWGGLNSSKGPAYCTYSCPCKTWHLILVSSLWRNGHEIFYP